MSARAAESAKLPPDPIAAIPPLGSSTSPLPVMTNVTSLSATIIIASRLRRYLSVRQSFASSSAARGSCRSEEHPSEFQSLMRISYAALCFKKKQNDQHNVTHSPPAAPNV